jgi:hypothetical protein
MTGKTLMVLATWDLIRAPFAGCRHECVPPACICAAAMLIGGAIFFASLGIPIYFVSRHFQRRKKRPRA